MLDICVFPACFSPRSGVTWLWASPPGGFGVDSLIVPEFDALFLVNCVIWGLFFQAVPLFLVPFVMGKLSNCNSFLQFVTFFSVSI